jgi:uncharacterized protein (DUF1501 family)
MAGVATTATPWGWAGVPAKTLVLIELKGGNDGLNTLVPFTDSTYYRLRPRLAVPRDKQLQLTDRFGLHPALESLMPSWDGGEMAVIQGLGYPQPNRSHFRSIEIWDSGSGSEEIISTGWLSPLLTGYQSSAPTDAVVMSSGSGPVAGAGVRVIHAARPNLIKQLSKLPKRRAVDNSRPALAHVLKVEEQGRQAALQLRRKLKRAPTIQQNFPQGEFGESMQTAAKVITAGLDIPLIKLELNGFDTHTQQAGTHQQLLQQLSQGVAALRSALIKQGLWDRTLIMSYSEFGRRVAENGNGGTDHGTAAPHFLWGGKVKGGLYGAMPLLSDLDSGDLRYTIDYRSLYQTVARDWFGNADYKLPGGRFADIDCLKTV